MLRAHISLTCRTHGTEDGATHAVDRSGQEGGLRAPVRAPGQDAFAGRAPADPRLPDAARRGLRPERGGRAARTAAGSAAIAGRSRPSGGCGESTQARLISVA